MSECEEEAPSVERDEHAGSDVFLNGWKPLGLCSLHLYR